MRIAFVLFSLSWFLQLCVLQRDYFNHWANYYQNLWVSWTVTLIWLFSAEASAILIYFVLSKHVSKKWARWVAVFIAAGLAALLLGTIIGAVIAPSPGPLDPSVENYWYLSMLLIYIGEAAVPAGTLLAALPIFQRANWSWEWLAAYLLLVAYAFRTVAWMMGQWTAQNFNTLQDYFNAPIVRSFALAFFPGPWYHMGWLADLISGLASLAFGLWIVYATRPAPTTAATQRA